MDKDLKPFVDELRKKAMLSVCKTHCWDVFDNHNNDEHCCWCQKNRRTGGG